MRIQIHVLIRLHLHPDLDPGRKKSTGNFFKNSYPLPLGSGCFKQQLYFSQKEGPGAEPEPKQVSSGRLWLRNRLPTIQILKYNSCFERSLSFRSVALDQSPSIQQCLYENQAHSLLNTPNVAITVLLCRSITCSCPNFSFSYPNFSFSYPMFPGLFYVNICRFSLKRVSDPGGIFAYRDISQIFFQSSEPNYQQIITFHRTVISLAWNSVQNYQLIWFNYSAIPSRTLYLSTEAYHGIPVPVLCKIISRCQYGTGISLTTGTLLFRLILCNQLSTMEPYLNFMFYYTVILSNTFCLSKEKCPKIRASNDSLITVLTVQVQIHKICC